MFSVNVVGDVTKWIGEKNAEMQKKMQGKVNDATLRIERRGKQNLQTMHNSKFQGRHVGSSFAGSGFNRQGAVGTDQRIGLYLEKGTKPHVILPKTKKSLAWPKGVVRRGGGTRATGALTEGLTRKLQSGKIGYGEVYSYSKKVNHPGTTGSHWLEKAGDNVLSRFDWRL